jgi:hypothetical protein
MTVDVHYRQSPNALCRRSFDSFVVASPSRPGLVLLEGVLARAWECLEQPLSSRQLNARLELAGAASNPSSDARLILDHLLSLGLVAADADGAESP